MEAEFQVSLAQEYQAIQVAGSQGGRGTQGLGSPVIAVEAVLAVILDLGYLDGAVTLEAGSLVGVVTQDQEFLDCPATPGLVETGHPDTRAIQVNLVIPGLQLKPILGWFNIQRWEVSPVPE